MFLKNKAEKISEIYHEYPRTFWNLVVITFIDHIGGALIFPFFALYLTSKFGVGMTQMDVLFAAFSLSSFGGSAIGSALAMDFATTFRILAGLIDAPLPAKAI